ncbi:alpha/beta fold hydrolase [Alteromonas sp. CYL-A6]|uniref:alpha/beta fold hydrolase n=1 Tax=Alteromonas nitratireducens TaxID=3390813 RepID=UPI0034ACADA1
MFDYQQITAAAPVARLLLAHGAGAGKEHDFMQSLAAALVAEHIEVVLFNFPYMQTSQATGKRRPPDKGDKLMAHFTELAAHLTATLPPLPLFIGGKSMGGRIATLVANNIECRGALAYGYPFHPPGKPEKTRVAHLPELTVPVRIIQGERDTFGNCADIATYTLGPNVSVDFLADGDHSFKPRKSSGHSQQEHIIAAAQLSAAFINGNLSS